MKEFNYEVSKDYDLLWNLIKKENKNNIVVFVDYSYLNDTSPPCRDVAKLRNNDNSLQISVRGMEYSGWYLNNQPNLEQFKKFCEKINLTFIEPLQEVYISKPRLETIESLRLKRIRCSTPRCGAGAFCSDCNKVDNLEPYVKYISELEKIVFTNQNKLE